jgi:hypothetical protein
MMKRIRTTLFITFVAMTLILIQAGTSAAYQLDWKSIQHRVYESGGSLNRLIFDILDDSGNYVSSADVVTDVVLKDPNGSPVNLSTLIFDPLFDFYGARFDLGSSAWVYNTPFQISDFYANILDPLVIGNYTLEVSMDNGPPLTGQIAFDFLLDLPVISSRTFQIHTDSAGNLYWTWDIPEQLLTLAKTYDLQIRAGVSAMVNGQEVALYWPNIPVEMGSSFAPSSIYQDLVSRADEIFFSLQVRTSNNYARAYSKTIVVQDLSSPVSVTPTTGRAEIIGTWDSGMWYYDVAESEWAKMTSNIPDGAIAAGDFNGDGKADVASIWDSGLWYQDGYTLDWTKVANTAPDSVSAGDVNGDGRSEIIGTWSNGLWYWDGVTLEWTKVSDTAPMQVTAGDVTGD